MSHRCSAAAVRSCVRAHSLCFPRCCGGGGGGYNRLLASFAAEGCLVTNSAECHYDFSGDGRVGVDDLLLMLATYGTRC